jgi:timeless
MDERLTAEILATCDNIGYADNDKYYKDPSCLECVKDLVLYLRRDDDDHSIRRLLGNTQVVQRDLLPLLKHYSEDLELYDVILRLLVNLTHPALLLYDEEVPKNKKYLSYYLEIEGNLREYKAAFVDKLVWKRLTDRLRHLLNLVRHLFRSFVELNKTHLKLKSCHPEADGKTKLPFFFVDPGMGQANGR